MSRPAFLDAATPRAVFAALPGARVVGGAVRDHLAGLAVQDLDMAAPFPPEEMARRLGAAGLGVFETGRAHGTLTALGPDRTAIEVTSLRRDVATDGRHAVVAWTTDWQEDAARRDFTINAMSMDQAGALHDPFGGAADLGARRVRFVGDAATRLAEDHLRALRFFRFQARYGGPLPDPAALAAIRDAVPSLARLSAERVWMELKRLLAAPDPRAALALMAEAGVLGAVLPEAGGPARLDAAVAAGEREAVLRLAMLLPLGTDLAALARRLRLSGEEAGRLAALHALAALPVGADAAGLGRFAALVAARGQATAAEVARVMQAEAPARELGALLALPPGPAFPLHGRDALALGVPPGPEVGRLLAATRDWWLAGGAAADHAACLARLGELARREAS